MTPSPAVVPLDPGAQAPGFFASAGRAEGDSPSRLVKAPKSPTDPTALEKPRDLADVRTPSGTAGAFAVIQFREWSDEWRIRTRVEPESFQKPQAPEGPRETDSLTLRAARKIMESCQFVATKYGGYSTFLTLTLDEDARARWEADETTIQREVSRFFDALQKVYARGMQEECPETGELVEIAPQGMRPHSCTLPPRPKGQPQPVGRTLDKHGQPLGLQYCWVAEVPDRIDEETGEVLGPNPHVHVLLRWRVPRRQFRAWAARIERLWGQGFAHLEKIKDRDAAGAYMMKAAGYMAKAQGKEDQGRIRGNRYGISAPARAPEWVTVEERELHIMGALIADVHQHLTEQHGEDYAARKALNRRRDAAPKGSRLRALIGRRLQKVRQRLEAVPVVCSRYQILLKGTGTAWAFMQWAKDDSGGRPLFSWLPEKDPGEAWAPGTRPDTRWFRAWKAQHYWRRACRAASKRFVWDECEWFQARDDYETWAAMVPA